MNDRFAITNKKTYKVYGNIFLHLLKLSKNNRLHSETILGIILKNANINVQKVNFRFARIRRNGIIDMKDKSFL